MDAIFVEREQVEVFGLGEPRFAVREAGIEERIAGGVFGVGSEAGGAFGEDGAFELRCTLEPPAVVTKFACNLNLGFARGREGVGEIAAEFVVGLLLGVREEIDARAGQSVSEMRERASVCGLGFEGWVERLSWLWSLRRLSGCGTRARGGCFRLQCSG